MKIDHLHPTLQALLTKLADEKYSVSDAREERVAWCFAGCPIEQPQEPSNPASLSPENVFYYGGWDNDAGHHLRNVTGHLVRGMVNTIVYYDNANGDVRHIDGTLAPYLSRGEIVFSGDNLHRPRTHEELSQGKFLLHHLSNGYTAIQWWDRTQGDRRGGSNSTFLAKGKYSADEMLFMFAQYFPSRKQRLDAEGITLCEVTLGPLIRTTV